MDVFPARRERTAATGESLAELALVTASRSVIAWPRMARGGSRDTSSRVYLKTYLMKMVRCMKEGVPIEAYLCWTLVDDVYPARLGLYNDDFANHRILDTDGFGQPSGRIDAHLIAALRSGDQARIFDAFVNAHERA